MDPRSAQERGRANASIARSAPLGLAAPLPRGATLRPLRGNPRIAAVACVCDGTPSGMSVRLAPLCQDQPGRSRPREFVRKRGPGEGQSL